MMADNDELDSYLAGLSNAVADELSGAIREQAQALSDAQRAALRSLEQDPPDSGDLEESCTVAPTDNPLEFIVSAGGTLTTGEVREGAGVPFDHVLAFEYGTSRQTARPFFWNTYNAMRDDMQAAINDTIREALK